MPSAPGQSPDRRARLLRSTISVSARSESSWTRGAGVGVAGRDADSAFGDAPIDVGGGDRCAWVSIPSGSAPVAAAVAADAADSGEGVAAKGVAAKGVAAGGVVD